MTTPKTAEEIARSIVTEIAREMTRDIDLEDSVRTAWTALDAYLLQESADVIKFAKALCDHNNKDDAKNFEELSRALEAFQKKHGGVV